MKEKYEHEIRELENSEKGLKDKYIDARTRLAESEANNQNLKAMATQMELQLSHSTKVGSCCRCVNGYMLLITLFLLPTSARTSHFTTFSACFSHPGKTFPPSELSS
jgi:hypothetical protein